MDVQQEYFRHVQAFNKGIIRLQRAKSPDAQLEAIHDIRRLTRALDLFIASNGEALFGDDFDLAAWNKEVEQDAQ